MPTSRPSATYSGSVLQGHGKTSDEPIEVARLVGNFRANGWQYDDEGKKVPVRAGTSRYELAYLDEVVLGVQASTSS